MSDRQDRVGDALADVHREFRDGLPGRLDSLRHALDRLSQGHEPAAVESLFHAAHSLKGAAPSFGAHELSAPAAELTEIARAWREGGGPREVADLERARTLLRQLQEEAARFASRSGVERR